MLPRFSLPSQLWGTLCGCAGSFTSASVVYFISLKSLYTIAGCLSSAFFMGCGQMCAEEVRRPQAFPKGQCHQLKEPVPDFPVIANQSADWCGNPFPIQRPDFAPVTKEKTDCHVASLLAMTSKSAMFLFNSLTSLRSCVRRLAMTFFFFPLAMPQGLCYTEIRSKSTKRQ